MTDSTRINYVRALKKWLVYACSKQISILHPTASDLAGFVSELSEKMSGASIASNLSGINGILKMFDCGIVVPASVERQIKGVKNLGFK